MNINEMMAQIPKQKWLIGPVMISSNSAWPTDLAHKVAAKLACPLQIEIDWQREHEHLIFLVTAMIGGKNVGCWGELEMEECRRNRYKLGHLVGCRLEGSKLDIVMFAEDHGLFNKGD